MMNTQKDRHTIEYEVIPECMYSDSAADFVNTIMLKKHHLILEMYSRLNGNVPGYVCPYSPEDFDVDAIVVGNMAGIMRIKMPRILQAGDMVRIYICHDAVLSRTRLYTVRIDEEFDTCFMTWVDDSHYLDHGKFKLSADDEMRVVMDFYMKYLSECGKDSE